MLLTVMPEARPYKRADGSVPFDNAFDSLEARAAARVTSTITKLESGLRPDVEPVGEGVFEARIHYGPGYRVYFGLEGGQLIILLLCGDKRTQSKDIKAAKAFWREYRRQA